MARQLLLFIYNTLLLLFFPLLILHYLKGRFLLKKYTKPLKNRLGFHETPLNKTKKRILIHAVSVGETVAAQPLTREIQAKFPDHEILFSNVTETGHKRARDLISADYFTFFPLDYVHCVRRYLRRAQPDLVVILETEIWPNFLQECHNQKIPVVFVNARISKKSFQRYKKFSWGLRTLLSPCLFCVQSETDSTRVRELGATNLVVCNNLKYDQLLLNLENKLLREELGSYFSEFPQPIVFFGSTHVKETNLCLQLISQWIQAEVKATFVVAPRHLNHMPRYISRARELGISFSLKSEGPRKIGNVSSLLFLDTYGELALSYEWSQIVFIGGSLEPVGGHSILEPALFAKPILYGPHMHNNEDVCAEFEMKGASLKLQSEEELKQRVEYLLESEEMRNSLGKNALSCIQSKTGASKVIVNAILKEFGNL